ncbi:MAG: hypothetical protein ABL866_17600 [Devosia sp.]
MDRPLAKATITIPCCTCVLAALVSFTSWAGAQSPPQGPLGGKEIVANPTVIECKRGWTGDAAAKWPKEQFDQFCAVIDSPAPIVINPTLEECGRGWVQTMRWSIDEFDKFCSSLMKSK